MEMRFIDWLVDWIAWAILFSSCYGMASVLTSKPKSMKSREPDEPLAGSLHPDLDLKVPALQLDSFAMTDRCQANTKLLFRG
jgi:hypothetical protein